MPASGLRRRQNNTLGVFSDIIKPKWTIEPKGTYDRDNNIYTLTLNAIDDVNHHRGLSRKFSSVDELMEDLNA